MVSDAQHNSVGQLQAGWKSPSQIYKTGVLHGPDLQQSEGVSAHYCLGSCGRQRLEDISKMYNLVQGKSNSKELARRATEVSVAHGWILRKLGKLVVEHQLDSWGVGQGWPQRISLSEQTDVLCPLFFYNLRTVRALITVQFERKRFYTSLPGFLFVGWCETKFGFVWKAQRKS